MSTNPTTETPGARPPRSGTTRVLTWVGIVIVAIVLIAVAIAVAVTLFRSTPVQQTADVTAPENVIVDVSNAEMRFAPSPDADLHVTLRGAYTGPRPELMTTTANGETRVTGGCPSGSIFTRCDVNLEVAIPASLPLTVNGSNGRITARELTGTVDISTTNGVLETTAMSGPVSLTTTNGVILVRDSRSPELTAQTTNGGIQVDFSQPPMTMTAATTNGAVEVKVPNDATTYRVSAQTTNGAVDTDAVPSDPSSARTLNLSTTNGPVTLHRRGS